MLSGYHSLEWGLMNQGRARRGGHADPGHPRRQRDARGGMTPDERDALVQGVGALVQRELAVLSRALSLRLDRLDTRIAAAEERLAGIQRDVVAVRRCVGAPAETGDPAGSSRPAPRGNG